MTTFARTRLKIFANQYEDSVNTLCLDVWKTFVIPYCEETGRKFSAGMGTWCFIDREGNHYYEIYHSFYCGEDDESEAWTAKIPAELVDILDSDTLLGTSLGALMPSYRPASFSEAF